MANFPSVTAGGAFESTAVQDAIKTLAEQSVADRLAALEYKSGSRDITTLCAIRATDNTGRIFLERTGPMVELSVEGVKFSASGVQTILTLTNGFRPRRNVLETSIGYWSPDIANTSFRVEASGGFASRSLATTGPYTWRALWITHDAPPTTLPGTPA